MQVPGIRMNFTSSHLNLEDKEGKEVSAGRGYPILQTKLCWQNIQDIISLFVMSNPLHRRERGGPGSYFCMKTQNYNNILLPGRQFWIKYSKTGCKLENNNKLRNGSPFEPFYLFLIRYSCM